MSERRRITLAGVAVAVLVLVAVAGVAAPLALRSLGSDTSAFRAGLATAEPPSPAERFALPADDARADLAQRAQRKADLTFARFDTRAAIRHAEAITAFGVRPGGSTAERKAAEYVATQLRQMGYEPVLDEFELPGGATSVNVIARAPGDPGGTTLILGAHTDTKPPSPGANDNASGCGVLLEMARMLKSQPAAADVEFVFWGAEEFLPRGTDTHHQGSRHHAAGLSPAQRARIAGVISVDMVGTGTRFHARTMLRGPQSLSDAVLAEAKRNKIAMSFLKDPGRTGWSDHEPYELLGIPAVWLQWLADPTYHTARDTADRLTPRTMDATGRLLTNVVYGLDTEQLEELAKH